MIVNAQHDNDTVTIRCDFSQLSFAPIAFSKKQIAMTNCASDVIRRELAKRYARQIEEQIFKELEQAFPARVPGAQVDLS